MITLYHGSNESNLAVIKDTGLFGGMFFSARESSASSHGDFLYTIHLDESEIADTSDLEGAAYRLRSMFKWLSDAQYEEHEDTIEGIVIYEESAYSYDNELILELFAEDDISFADLYAQKLRGQLAAALGFKAVRMSDEHGTSYLVLPGTRLATM